MNRYKYWFYANNFFFGNLIGFMAGNIFGLGMYILISYLPMYALYSLPFVVAERYFGMAATYNKYIYWTLIVCVPAIHTAVFCPGSKRYARWESQYRGCCTDGKNLLALLFSLCCVAAWALCFWG